MITERDLQDAIKQCQNERNPNANTCIKLAAYYTILDHLYPSTVEPIPQPIKANSSDFYRAIEGKDTGHIFGVINELMETVEVINPRLYDAVIQKLKENV